jgi:hypothetical protein
MIEPWVNSWSCFVYQNLHHERFDPTEQAWEFESSGPLSGANGALPWMIFERDQTTFEEEFPTLKVEVVLPIMPFCYLLSGGLSMRGLLPGFTYGLVRSVEGLIERSNKNLGMFALIVLRKTTAAFD